MPNKGVENKPSETALFAALRRYFAHLQYGDERFGPDYLAYEFLPPQFRFFLRFRGMRQSTRQKLDTFLPGLTEMMIARTAYFDQLFKQALQDNVPQIVLLGAGYDARSYRFASLNQGTRIFELDAAPTQNWKIRRLKKSRTPIPEWVSFAPINFNTHSIPDVLAAAGYDPSLQTLIIWEGVSYYLTQTGVKTTLAFVQQNNAPGTALAFDYTLAVCEDKQAEMFGVNEFISTMAQEHSDEELLFSLDEGEIKPFLQQHGLEMIEHLDAQAIEEKYLTDEDGRLIGKMTEHFCFVTAKSR